ncbi:diguanylate cyclase domain-containing protein [Virgibacillus kimchii]
MHLAFHDSLTGLKNRAAFNDLLQKELKKNHGNLSLLMMDLDNFKLVNDRLGHDRGDEVLKMVADCIRSVIRKEDSGIRLGGDEFMIIRPAYKKHDAEGRAIQLIETIKQTLAKDKEVDQVQVTVSVGIAISPEDGKDIHALYKRADTALYASKDKGKNQYKLFSDS